MADETPTFRTVRHGYDPAAVDEHVSRLSSLVESAQARTGELTRRLEQLQRSTEERLANTPAAPTFADLGERIGQILQLADEEAAHIRATADSEVRQKVAEIETANAKAREDAERFSTETRSSATQEAARILEDAKRAADQMLDEAQRQATARREEAEAMYERQRAQAAKAAADFEQTLAERRDAAEHDFRDRSAQNERELASVQENIARLRQEGEQAHAEAQRAATRAVQEAEGKAAQIVNEAMARADRIRAESERELAAATQRRDSINAQLANVRQMLATLTGVAHGGIGDDPSHNAPLPVAVPIDENGLSLDKQDEGGREG
jgi:hypothetical protein